MARKKSKRKINISQEALEQARRQAAGGAVSAAPAGKKQVAGPAQHVSEETMAVEYAYVLNDLSSMAILAALAFIGLVVVALLF